MLLLEKMIVWLIVLEIVFAVFPEVKVMLRVLIMLPVLLARSMRRQRRMLPCKHSN